MWQQIQYDTVLTRSKSFVLFTASSQNWLAFAKLHKPLFTEHGSVNFPNTNPPTDEDNNAYCEVSVRLSYEKKYSRIPPMNLFFISLIVCALYTKL